jgi:hypothetical protein
MNTLQTIIYLLVFKPTYKKKDRNMDILPITVLHREYYLTFRWYLPFWLFFCLWRFLLGVAIGIHVTWKTLKYYFKPARLDFYSKHIILPSGWFKKRWKVIHDTYDVEI